MNACADDDSDCQPEQNQRLRRQSYQKLGGWEVYVLTGCCCCCVCYWLLLLLCCRRRRLQEETSVPCECNEYIGELLRGVRQHLST